MVTSTSPADDDEAPHHPRRSSGIVNALIGALVTFFLALMALAYNAGIASANISTLRSTQVDLTKEVSALRDNQNTTAASTSARLSAIQQMQQDMSNTLAQMQAQMQAKNDQGTR